MRGAIALLATALGLAGCIRPGEERARLDPTVGLAETPEARVVVLEGLAAVRSLQPGELTLWASAPVVELGLTSLEAGDRRWRIQVDNAMPSAALVAADSAGDPLLATRLDLSLPTRRAWELDLPAGETISIRIAPPDADDLGAFRFAVLSDIQEGIGSVQDIYALMNEDPDLRFVVSAGDLTEAGTPGELDRFQDELEGLDVPFFTTNGNHDAGPPPKHWHARFGRHSLSFAYRGVRFHLIDSANATIDPLVMDWLDGWLDQAHADGHQQVFVTHHAPLDPIGERNGAFGSRNEAAALLNRLAAAGVGLCLYGHVHSYYAFENAGIPAYISGGGGALPERLDGIGRHYLTVDADPERGVDQVQLVRVGG